MEEASISLLPESEKSVQRSYPNKNMMFRRWITIIIETDRGIVNTEIGATETETRIAIGGQNKIGENMAASMWYVVLASIPSSVRSPKYQARRLWNPVEGMVTGEAKTIRKKPSNALDHGLPIHSYPSLIERASKSLE